MIVNFSLGSAQDSCDSLSYKTLMNVDMLKSYMDMLRDTHWLVVMGMNGTCLQSLAVYDRLFVLKCGTKLARLSLRLFSTLLIDLTSTVRSLLLIISYLSCIFKGSYTRGHIQVNIRP